MYTCLTSQSFHINSHLISFLSLIILILTASRHNLWSYTSCSFLQFPISFSRKSLRTDQHQHCSQTQSTVYSQCHRTSVTPTFRKILKISTCTHTHTHTHTHSLHFNSQVFRKLEGQQNILKLQWALLQISTQFLDSAIFIPSFRSKILQALYPSKISLYKLRHFFYGVISPLYL